MTPCRAAAWGCVGPMSSRSADRGTSIVAEMWSHMRRYPDLIEPPSNHNVLRFSQEPSMRAVVFAVVSLSIAPVLSQSPAAPDFSADRFKAHVTFLADDLLEGREAGTRG